MLRPCASPPTWSGPGTRRRTRRNRCSPRARPEWSGASRGCSCDRNSPSRQSLSGAPATRRGACTFIRIAACGHTRVHRAQSMQIVGVPHWDLGRESSASRQRAVPVGNVPSMGIALTGSRSPSPDSIRAVTRCTKSLESAGTAGSCRARESRHCRRGCALVRPWPVSVNSLQPAKPRRPPRPGSRSMIRGRAERTTCGSMPGCASSAFVGRNQHRSTRAKNAVCMHGADEAGQADLRGELVGRQ